MIRIACIAAAALMATMAEGTSVAVLEFGKGGVARRTTTESPLTSAGAVGSFWSSMHTGVKTEGQPRRFSKQHPGMTVVPDMFQKPSGGFAIGITGSGMDLSAMPTVSKLLDQQKGEALGHFFMKGDVTEKLMDKASAGEKVSSSIFKNTAIPKINVALEKESPNTLEAVHVNIEDEDQAADLDAQLSEILSVLAKKADESGVTVIVHIVVDETEGQSKLEPVATEEETSSTESTEPINRRLAENDNQDQDETEVKIKTIFQIQYFQLVLWTAVGLVVILFSSIFIFMGMPLMPDTLLFGESAKMMGE